MGCIQQESQATEWPCDFLSLHSPEQTPFGKNEKSQPVQVGILVVRMKGLEPSRDKALVPKTSVSTNFTTSASKLDGKYK